MELEWLLPQEFVAVAIAYSLAFPQFSPLYLAQELAR
jgi:hypothetical protein